MKLLTILIPTYNREKYLKANLNYIINEIKNNKLEKNIKIIVGDNNSQDKTVTILNKLKTQFNFLDFYKNKKNVGVAKNIIKLIRKKIKTKYIMVLGDDDFFKKNKLKELIKILSQYNPDVLYLNYQPVNTYINNKNYEASFIKVKSIIAPGINLNKNIFINNKKYFLKFLANIGFYNFRMFLSQQSILIIKDKIIKKNVLHCKNAYKNRYPVNLILYYNLPNKFLFLKEKLVFITVNNRSWNYDVLKANEVVKKYFNPLQKMILKKYQKEMSLKLKLIIIASIIYTYLVPIVYKIFYLIGLHKILIKAQFGEEKRNR